MKKGVKIIIVAILLLALIAAGVIYLARSSRHDELLIGEDRAQSIALRDADMTEQQVTRIKCKLKYDDGKWYYDVEFNTLSLEYDYDIDAYSGAILEKDVDDN